MKKKKKGVIFNIGSSSAYDCSKETSIYCSTKHALLGMSKAFNTELQSHGVRSIFIAPGSMKTSMGRKVKNQDNSRLKYFVWNTSKKTIDDKCIDGVDVIVNLAGSSVFSLWTKHNKKMILNSRLDALSTIYGLIQKKKNGLKSY